MFSGGDRLKKQRALTSKLQKDISEAEAEATRKGVQVKANTKTLDKMRKEGVKDGGWGRSWIQLYSRGSSSTVTDPAIQSFLSFLSLDPRYIHVYVLAR